ncbi:putative glutamate receptor [Amblyomma americanum]
MQEWPPYQMGVRRNGELHLEGPGGNALEAVATNMNFTYTLTEAINYGVRQPNGSWTGMIGFITRGEADAAISLMTINHERHGVVRYGPCLDAIAFTILSSSPPPRFDAFDYIRAFDIEVWLLIVVFLVIISCLLAVGEWMPSSAHCRKTGQLFRKAYAFGWDLLGLLLSESCPRRYGRVSQQVLLAVWLMTVVVLANSFASLLKSQQAVANFEPDVDSIEDVAERPYLTPVIPTGTYYEIFAEHTNSEAVKNVWALSRHRKAMFPMHEIFSDSRLAKVAERRAVIITDHGSILVNMAAYCERHNVRTFVVARHPLEQSPFGYAFSPLLDGEIFRKIYVRFQQLYESGLFTKWMDDSQGHWQRCIQSDDTLVKSIRLEDVVPFFMLWGFMCCLAFCAFLAELARARMLYVQRR